MTPDSDDTESSGRSVVERTGAALVSRRVAFAAAAVAVAAVWLDERYSWLDYRPGGTTFFTYVRPVFFAVLVVGALVAVTWEWVGGVIAAFAAGAIGALVVHQLVVPHAVLVIVMLGIPATLWTAADLIDRSPRRAVIGVVVVSVAAIGGVASGGKIYDRTWGPTHPESSTVALPGSPVRWIWAGGVTADTVHVRARTERGDVDTLRLALAEGDDLAAATYFDVVARDGTLASFEASGLEPDTRYRYAVEVDGVLDTVRTGTFTTFPTGAASFRVTVGACARVGSNGAVFDAIAAERPLFHLITGDFHYGDISDDERDRYDDVIDLTLREPAQAALYRSTPIAYVWDDHDYGADNSDSFSTSRLAAMRAYRANVPSYRLAGELSAVYQKFDVGRVRFLLTDARSAREPGVSMLGQEQLEWFLDEVVRASEEQALVVWLNPVPWVARDDEGADHWGGYPEERRSIAETIAANGIDNLLMVSGDAHMVAIDDGTNTDFSTDGDSGFPLLHAAALDRPGSTKGGPYSHGSIAGGGQFGVIDIDDSGDAVTVSLAAKNHRGEVLLSYSFLVGSE